MVEKFDSPPNWVDPAGRLGDDNCRFDEEAARRERAYGGKTVVRPEDEGLYPGDPARTMAIELAAAAKRVSGT